MCPACLTTFALFAIGATSTGGVAAFVVKKLRFNTRGKNGVAAPPRQVLAGAGGSFPFERCD